ncbi:MAG: radical SAM protein [Promethearchaeota archaeon]
MYFELELKKNREKIKKITAGTKEWSDHSVNCVSGCSNDCRYCYAKKMAIRFGRKTKHTWKIMEVREKDVKKHFRKRNGRFMFPTSHDITGGANIIEACLTTLKHILEPGNEVLITTKPRFEAVKRICEDFRKYKKQIQFRFTITSNNDKLLEFWEPRAPSYEERLKALKLAYEQGYKTSVSIEPFLNNPLDFINDLIPHVTESIWVGPMNYLTRNGFKSQELVYFDKIRELNKPKNLLKMFLELKNYKLIRFKDSFLIRLYNAGLLQEVKI